MRMKYLNITLIAVTAGALLLSCGKKKDKNSPGYEYMPDMYRSQSYKPFEYSPIYADGITMRNQVEGTIMHSFDPEKSINYMPFYYSDTPEGRDSAIAYLKNPLPVTQENIDEGKRLYDVFCVACHGTAGKGDGPVVKLLLSRENFGLQPPAYDSDQLKEATEGQIYYATQYGKGNMGPYTSQLNSYERWQVVQYVQTLQGGDAAEGEEDIETVDETNGEDEASVDANETE